MSTIIRATHKTIHDLIKSCTPYKHGSSTGMLIDGMYRIYSYNTLMLEVNITTGAVEFFNHNYYSVTTSRLQNVIKSAWGIK